jgi:hypothetical protein
VALRVLVGYGVRVGLSVSVRVGDGLVVGVDDSTVGVAGSGEGEPVGNDSWSDIANPNSVITGRRESIREQAVIVNKQARVIMWSFLLISVLVDWQNKCWQEDHIVRKN